MRQTIHHGPEAKQLRRCRRRDWPGIGACAAVACLILALSWFKLSSLDTGYHLAYGGHFLETGEIVDRDPFLYPENAVPFVNANWGSQIVMALAARLAGPGGLIALRILLIVAIFACIGIVMRRLGVGWLWLAWAWLLAGLAAYERFSMRPELFSYALMSVMLVLLTRGITTPRDVVAMGLLQLAWVNLHSYFLVGVLLTGAFLIGELPRKLRTPHRDAPPGHASRRLRLLAVALAVQAAVCLINPWHWRGAVFPIATLQFLHGQEVMGGAAGDTSTSAWSHISEFQSPFSFHGQDINARTIRAYYVLLAVAALGLIALLLGSQFGPALVIIIFFVMSALMRRNIAQFALVAAPLAVGAIAAAFPWSAFDRTLQRWVRPMLVLATISLACWWTYGIAGGRFYYTERRITRQFGTGYSNRTFQRDAVRWLAGQPDLQPRLFVDYFSSSNALPSLPSRFKLFVDTNTFAVSDPTLDKAFKLVTGRVTHNRVFDEYGVNVVMLRCVSNAHTLVRRIVADHGEWALVYVDPHMVIFARRTARHDPVILANERSEKHLDLDTWLASATGPSRVRAITLYTMATVPLSLGWYRSAAALLSEAVELAPDHHESWINLGICRAQTGNANMRAGRLEAAVRAFEAAQSCFQRALQIDPDNPVASFNLDRVRATFDRGG